MAQISPKEPRRHASGSTSSDPSTAPRERARDDGRSAASQAIRGLLVELISVGREMVRIPVAGFFAVAEFAGRWVLAGWLVVWPLAKRAWLMMRKTLALLERELTPARGVAVVAVAGAIVLAASQFSDYRGVDIGSDAYAGVANIAPAPQVDKASAGSAHLWLGLPLAAAAIALTVLALRRRPAVARLLTPIGLAVIAITLLVDLPNGLDAGDAQIAYDQVHARLLGGFWAQLSAGVVLVAVGPILTAYLSAGRRRRHSAKRRRPPGLGRIRALLPGRPKIARPGS